MLKVRPFKKVIKYPAAFSAGYTALSFYLLCGGFGSSHRTTGRSGSSAAALRAIFCTARLRAGNRTRIVAATLGVLAGTARLRATRLTGRL